jgi:outer membrane protein assembly factor BamB
MNMQTKQKFSQVLVAVIVVLTVTVSTFSPSLALGQSGDGLKRQYNAENGRVSFIGPESGHVLSAQKALGTFMRPQDPGMSLAKRFAPEFGIDDPERNLAEMKVSKPGDGRVTVRYQQTYQGIPVMGGELIVNTNEQGDLYSMNGEVSPGLSLQTQPEIASDKAQAAALGAVAKWYQGTPVDFVTSEPELWIYDESLLQPSTRPVELVWRMDVTPKNSSLPVHELVLVDARRGSISLHFNQIDTAWKSLTSNITNQKNISETTKSLQESGWPIYFEVALDETRGWIYCSDSAGDKVDVISMTTLQLIKSFNLSSGANPKGIALNPDGSELAVAQYGASSILFLDPTNGDVVASITPAGTHGLNVPWDVVYGRPGRLYSSGSPSSYGIDYIHVIDTTTHTEINKSGYIIRNSPFLTISADKNSLFANDSGKFSKFDISTDTISTPTWAPSSFFSTQYILLPDESNFLLTIDKFGAET